LHEKVLLIAQAFQERLTSLVANWVRVGYCQGNFNSDNCAAGGFSLDYGPFGFMDMFDPHYQPWTGGGEHFSFLNQPQAAERNFHMFCLALMPLLQSEQTSVQALHAIEENFTQIMQKKMMQMYAEKLGLEHFNAPLFNELIRLMQKTSVDYTLFFRELSNIPSNITALRKSFYKEADEALLQRWEAWLKEWRAVATKELSNDELSQKMKQVNPKYTLREWFLVPAYQQAEQGDYTLIHELQEVMNKPYEEQSDAIEQKYYRKKPSELFKVAGISHVSCSS